MMTPELLKALQLIKEECAKHETNCNDCSMRCINGDCGITDTGTPENWKLEKREEWF